MEAFPYFGHALFIPRKVSGIHVVHGFFQGRRVYRVFGPPVSLLLFLAPRVGDLGTVEKYLHEPFFQARGDHQKIPGFVLELDANQLLEVFLFGFILDLFIYKGKDPVVDSPVRGLEVSVVPVAVHDALEHGVGTGIVLLVL